MEIKDGTIYLSEEEELGGVTEYPTDFDITQIIDTQYYETKQTKATVKYWKLEKKERIK